MEKKFYILISALVVVLAFGFYLDLRYSQENTLPKSSPSASKNPSPSPTILPSESPIPSPIPDSFEIENFPFESQAPFANWDELHDEACEEAAVILTYYYLKNLPLNSQEMENQIQEMVAWEIRNWGSHKDLTIKETGDLMVGFYNYSNFEAKNLTLEDLKREISQNHPVIVPTAGRLLGNPYFRQPGPVYHMVVAIGYEGNTIIVQDVGTRNGNHYEYNEQVFYNAFHDWAGSPENIENGSKNALIVY